MSLVASPYVLPASAFVALDGLRVHFTREGAGRPIVLLHGSGSSLHIFDAVTSRLSAHFEVIRIDLPGFGLTGPRRDRDYTVTRYVSLLDRFADACVDGSFVLAGHSFGGQVAWTYALDHPERLRGLVLMNPTGYPDKSVPLALRMARNPVLRPVMRRWGSRAMTAKGLAALAGPGSEAVDDAMIDRVYALTSLPGNRSAFVDFANTAQEDRSAEISQMAVPTLVLRSELVDAQHFARDIAGSREVVLRGVGHLMPAEAPSIVSDAIIEFAAGRHA